MGTLCKQRTFPVEGCDVFEPEHIAVGKVREDVVRCTVAEMVR